MDIIEYTKKFQCIEIENDFFSKKTPGGVLYWDVVRYEVFNVIYNRLAKAEYNSTGQLSELSLMSKIYHLLKFLYSTNFVKYKYLCFTYSRYSPNGGQHVDLILNDLLSIIQNKSMIIETYMRADVKYNYPIHFNFGWALFRYKEKLKGIFKKNPQKKFDVAEILNCVFETDIDLNPLIGCLLTRFEQESRYYQKLFTKMKPAIIFMTMNGIQKGMFAAAQKLRIPLVELQHAQIGFAHPAYSYPESIRPNQLETLPEYFFTFSPFWTKNINYPVKNIISIGNSYFALKTIKKTRNYSILFIFANIYSKDMMGLLDKLLYEGFRERVCVKLHPNQAHEVDCIKKHYAKHPNVDIVFIERSVKDLLSASGSIIVVQSTSLYEALHNNIKVMILKIKHYKLHANVFDDPNVYLVENAQDVLKALSNGYVKAHSISYFDDFNNNKLLDFLKVFE